MYAADGGTVPDASNLYPRATSSYSDKAWCRARLTRCSSCGPAFNDALEAERITIQLLGAFGGDGQADAFQHALWSWLMTRDIGKSMARKIGGSHENVPGESGNRRYMDTRNNYRKPVEASAKSINACADSGPPYVDMTLQGPGQRDPCANLGQTPSCTLGADLVYAAEFATRFHGHDAYLLVQEPISPGSLQATVSLQASVEGCSDT